MTDAVPSQREVFWEIVAERDGLRAENERLLDAVARDARIIATQAEENERMRKALEARGPYCAQHGEHQPCPQHKRARIDELETEAGALSLIRDVAETFIAHDDTSPFDAESWDVWHDQWDGLKESLRNVISMSYGDEKESDDGSMSDV